MKRVLITGGAGFIGSHLADALVKKHYGVTVFDNLSTGDTSHIPKQAEFVRGDIRNVADVRKAFARRRFDAVLHVAGQASQVNAYTDPTFDVMENYLGTVNMVEAAIGAGTPRFLYASSMTVYGPAGLPVSETNPCVPLSYYAISKYAAERFVHASAHRTDLRTRFDVTSFRMFNVYGPRQSLKNPYQGALAILTGNILRNEPITIYGDGRQTRDFVYVDDVVRIWIAALFNRGAYDQVFNIGSGRDISMNALVKKLIRGYGKDRAYSVFHKEFRPGEQRRMRADMRKTKRMLGIVPETLLDQGIAKTRQWIESHA